MFNVIPNTLVIGTDKWHLENLINGNFFWFGHPFEKSRSKGFIFTEKPFKTVLPFTLIVDLEESSHLDPLTFLPSNTVFYSETWSNKTSSVASFIKNIIYFKNYKVQIIKNNYIMLEEF